MQLNLFTDILSEKVLNSIKYLKSQLNNRGIDSQSALDKCTTHEIQVGDGQDGLQFRDGLSILHGLYHQVDQRYHVLLVQVFKLFPEVFRQRETPPLPVRMIAEVLGVDEHHATSRDSGGRCVLQVVHLEGKKYHINCCYNQGIICPR